MSYMNGGFLEPPDIVCVSKLPDLCLPMQGPILSTLVIRSWAAEVTYSALFPVLVLTFPQFYLSGDSSNPLTGLNGYQVKNPESSVLLQNQWAPLFSFTYCFWVVSFTFATKQQLLPSKWLYCRNNRQNSQYRNSDITIFYSFCQIIIIIIIIIIRQTLTLIVLQFAPSGWELGELQSCTWQRVQLYFPC
jgi:hypothetical protein